MDLVELGAIVVGQVLSTLVRMVFDRYRKKQKKKHKKRRVRIMNQPKPMSSHGRYKVTMTEQQFELLWQFIGNNARFIAMMTSQTVLDDVIVNAIHSDPVKVAVHDELKKQGVIVEPVVPPSA